VRTAARSRAHAMVNATSMAFVTTAENFTANALETAKKANLLVVGRQVLTEWIERGAVPDGLTAPSRPAGEQDAGSSTRVARHALQRTRRGRTDRVNPSSWRIRRIAAYDHGRSAPPQRGQASMLPARSASTRSCSATLITAVAPAMRVKRFLPQTHPPRGQLVLVVLVVDRLQATVRAAAARRQREHDRHRGDQGRPTVAPRRPSSCSRCRRTRRPERPDHMLTTNDANPPLHAHPERRPTPPGRAATRRTPPTPNGRGLHIAHCFVRLRKGSTRPLASPNRR
jgi:hypothetical protein